MIHPERSAEEGEALAVPLRPLMSPREPTWRYLGDRSAADLAYCARFGVNQAPEPIVALGGAWAYALPTSVRSH
jgi:hypothetical protein